MKNINPVVIIDFNSYERTIKYIEDFVNYVLIFNDLSFIIVDTTEENNNYYNFRDEIDKRLKINRSEKISVDDNDRVLEAMKYFVSISDKLVEIIHIKSRENYGFAIANNIGANIAKDNYRFDHIIFSNSDISFSKKFDLNKLIGVFAKNHEIALVGPKVIGLDGNNQSPCKQLSLWDRWNFNSLIWPINSIIRTKLLNTYDDLLILGKDEYVYRIIGAFMIFDFNKFMEIGMFDEGTFLYAEELIIAEKLIERNYKTLYVCSEEIIHEQGGSVNKKFSSYRTLKNKFESEMYYYKNYRQKSKATIFLSEILFRIYLGKLIVVRKIKNSFLDIISIFRGEK
ncbi:MAG: glycosyltransferase family 2 protein [Clostridium sp.]|nr:glycosyltransferase family 2 protein [Clostridium sp.]